MIDYLNKETYNFYLPENLIATEPNYERDHCKLMLLNKKTGQLEHKIFSDIIGYLNSDDVLVLNDSKVIPARIYAKKNTGGGSEILLLNKINNDDSIWECLIKGKNIKENDILYINYSHIEKVGNIEALIETDNISTKIIKFSKPLTSDILNSIGNVPLPPYIIQSRKKKGEEEYNEKDKEFYQNVYAKNEGSIASPTSGLHFTSELLEKIKNIGITVCYVTLHVGFSTFNPLKEDDLRNHVMHEEKFIIPNESAEIILDAKKSGRRIVSCGTTVSRVLESEYENYNFKRLEGSTNIFIYPPYKFKCVDALITNFHTPHSTLLAMVSAFAGYDNIMNAYKEAIADNYRFFSYGDAMFMY
ncbi:tRNA preQ1(34) S-adenosylmethionine ribosyltransferase-isomerase QueA [uncultured Brachyspira sp.]|uniref:tRNA preQ1(34) S-adenosylmethionine ribosyltransferase-isomerase QueA n=1 Tax=uncultured Brachyspira sp. TaxID=221953 RepID=UPI00260E14A9|nr:tRNA preQ1(34) S-adenosylmethionine ribosyltransferase-isomerase QueA [uncultured Brachyspira sp.]